MITNNPHNPAEEMAATIKKVYSSPCVKEYGNIKELVQSGNNGGIEGDDGLSSGVS